MKRLIYTIAILLTAGPLLAAETSAGRNTGNTFSEVVVILFLIALLFLIVSLVLLKTVQIMANEIKNPSLVTLEEPKRMLEYSEWEATEKSSPGIWSKLMGLRPISEEKDIMMDHEFDGIVELDNPTPAWFMGLFYSTILFAVVYMLNYHVFEWSPLQDEEYAIEMKAAEVEKAAFLANSGELIDENSVKVSTEAGVIAAGKAVYTQNCIACHGVLGEGTVGPNLADDSWIHGGTVNDIFKTIKYGVPEKGMIAWEKTLTPKQTSDLSNYILSLQGTNPPNPKAPQGVKL
ncbi:MAG: cbb3-type cytochrome c oxidase N-terminal domain-containing protein [Daejeonella sp.]|uniref:cbb3-type cytochrome c oxidase N-terminal domain-containing protein n=1 Tax=Daejeonella sp. TaxID=2805397 RepID=UPI002733BF8C|nr:cbb3-type cytochrome c oxidase N-terminal domain-containing protein [Daejeonella sp.]MDP3468667.1 cbb3-type cytochrome c oxidase N-terminal domain-containing protein [Daejeonella sp.]